MEIPGGNLEELTGTSKRLASRLIATGENRFALLMLELEEERERLLRVIFMALGMTVFALLAGFALTLAVALCFRDTPIAALLVLTGLYAAGALGLYAGIMKLKRDWETLAGTLDQLRKDREWLEQALS